MKLAIIALTLLCVGVATSAKLGGATKANPKPAEPKPKGQHPNKAGHEKPSDEHKPSHGTPVFRDDYIYMENHKIFVKLNENPKPWADARAYCEDEGASLAVIADDEEAKEITEMLRQLPASHTQAFIGIHDLFANGEFMTVDGESMESPKVFKIWAMGEPNNENGNEHCVVLNKEGKLNDVPCEEHLPFLCKKDDEGVKFNPECGTADPEYHLTPSGDQCFKLHTDSKSWRDAFVTCKAEEGNLAVLNSEEEADLYIEAFEKVPIETIEDDTHKNIIHVGFHELFKLHEYLTIDGQTLKAAGFDKWSKGQPDNPEGERCGSLHRSGMLNDIDCESKAMFVCEKDAGEDADKKSDEKSDESQEDKEEERPESNDILQQRKKRQSAPAQR